MVMKAGTIFLWELMNIYQMRSTEIYISVMMFGFITDTHVQKQNLFINCKCRRILYDNILTSLIDDSNITYLMHNVCNYGTVKELIITYSGFFINCIYHGFNKSNTSCRYFKNIHVPVEETILQLENIISVCLFGIERSLLMKIENVNGMNVKEYEINGS